MTAERLEGINRAIVVDLDPLGRRRGVHRSHVITPYIYALTTVEQRASLRRFEKYSPHEPIVWRRSGRGLYWVTLKFASLEDEIVKMARRRERGIRQSIATLARWTGASADLVARVLRSLAARGIGTLTTERGRFARALFRLVGNSIPQPNRYKAAGLNAEHDERVIAKYRTRYTDAEWERLMRQGEEFRAALARQIADAGCATLEEYYALSDATYGR